MCGIVGFVNNKENKEKIIKDMSKKIEHRGPDGEGFYIDDNCALAHRRLAIIDLNTGAQPIYNEDKSKVIIYNGEVYNFKELKEKCLYCNNLIDYKKIEQKSKDSSGNFEQKDNIVTFINLGRHDEKQKKLSRIIEATKKLNEEGYIFRVIFVGDGPDNEMYQNHAKDIQNIEFLKN